MFPVCSITGDSTSMALRRPGRRSGATLSVEAVASWGTPYDLFQPRQGLLVLNDFPVQLQLVFLEREKATEESQKSTLPTAYPACADSRVSRAWG